MSNNFVDHFGKAGANYASFRPDYPPALYDVINAYMGEGKRDLAIDVGTGTGQAAIPLAKYFKNVLAFDPSEGQIKNASSAVPNIKFEVGPAEKLNVNSESADLVATAQAAHWFDLPAFYNEAYRVLRPEGTLAIWGYGTMKIDDDTESNEIFQDFYNNVIGEKYWPPQRKLVENSYKEVNPSPPFSNFIRDESLKIEKNFDLNGFFGYLSTWSGVKEYREQTKTDPLPPLHKKLLTTPVASRSFRVSFPVFLLLAKKIVR